VSKVLGKGEGGGDIARGVECRRMMREDEEELRWRRVGSLGLNEHAGGKGRRKHFRSPARRGPREGRLRAKLHEW